MPIIGRIMIALVVCGAIVLPVKSQEQKQTPVPFTVQEQQIVLEMCEVAVQAIRIRFDGRMCDSLKRKFDEAEFKQSIAPKEEKK